MRTRFSSASVSTHFEAPEQRRSIFSSGMQKNMRTLRPSPLIWSLGRLYALSYNVQYTCSRTLGDHYNYDALKIELILLSHGASCMLGSVLGGRWLDQALRRLTSANGRHYLPEAVPVPPLRRV